MSHVSKYIISTLLLVITSCGKHENPVPVTSISYSIINIDADPRYESVWSINGSTYIESGAMCVGYNCNGVVLYRVKHENTVDDFRAFDRTCTYEANACSMEIDPHFPDILRCPCCGSEFNMNGGYIEKGPAEYPLREFPCDYYNGDLRLHSVSY